MENFTARDSALVANNTFRCWTKYLQCVSVHVKMDTVSVNPMFGFLSAKMLFCVINEGHEIKVLMCNLCLTFRTSFILCIYNDIIANIYSAVFFVLVFELCGFVQFGYGVTLLYIYRAKICQMKDIFLISRKT